MTSKPESKPLADGRPTPPPDGGPNVGDVEPKLKEDYDPTSASEGDDSEAGTINEKALLRKLDARLLPAVGILYLLSFLDRSNVGNARIEGLADDLGMTGNQYLTGLTLYFIGYVLFEVSHNHCLLPITED
jgi:hypothetical protein